MLLPLVRKVRRHVDVPSEGHWRARRGEYRVRCTVDDAEGIIHVLDIDHRRDAYLS